MARAKTTFRLRILGKTIRTYLVPPTHKGLCDGPEDGEPGHGRYEENSLKVYVASGQPLEQEQDTHLHELFHVIDDLLDIGLDEAQVVKLTTALLAMLKDNPNLFDYLKRRK